MTTRGRVSGRSHEIEIWFVERDSALFLMAGGGRQADWVKNMLAHPNVTVRVGEAEFETRADVDPRGVDDRTIRQAMAAKYQSWEPGAELSEWAQTALLVRLRPNP